MPRPYETDNYVACPWHIPQVVSCICRKAPACAPPVQRDLAEVPIPGEGIRTGLVPGWERSLFERVERQAGLEPRAP